MSFITITKKISQTVISHPVGDRIKVGQVLKTHNPLGSQTVLIIHKIFDYIIGLADEKGGDYFHIPVVYKNDGTQDGVSLKDMKLTEEGILNQHNFTKHNINKLFTGNLIADENTPIKDLTTNEFKEIWRKGDKTETLDGRAVEVIYANRCTYYSLHNISHVLLMENEGHLSIEMCHPYGVFENDEYGEKNPKNLKRIPICSQRNLVEEVISSFEYMEKNYYNTQKHHHIVKDFFKALHTGLLDNNYKSSFTKLGWEAFGKSYISSDNGENYRNFYKAAFDFLRNKETRKSIFEYSVKKCIQTKNIIEYH